MTLESIKQEDWYAHGYDYVIVGGGPVGLITAYKLAKQGQKVCLLEKNKDFGNFAMNGGCHTPYHADEPNYRAAQEEALADLDALAAELGVTVSRHYTVQMARTEAEMVEMKLNADYLNSIGFDAVMLTPEEIRQYAPNVKEAFASATVGACAYQEPRFDSAADVYKALVEKLSAMPNVKIITQARYEGNINYGSYIGPHCTTYIDTSKPAKEEKKILISCDVIDASGVSFSKNGGSALDANLHIEGQGGRAAKICMRGEGGKPVKGYFNQWPNAVYLPMGEYVLYYEPNNNGDWANLAVTKEKRGPIAEADYKHFWAYFVRMMKMADKTIDVGIKIDDNSCMYAQHNRLMAEDGLPILGEVPYRDDKTKLAVAFGGNGWTGAIIASKFYSEPEFQERYAEAFSQSRFQKNTL